MTERSRFWDSTTVGDASEAPYDAGTEFARVLLDASGAGGLSNKGGVFRSVLGSLAATTPAANTVRFATGAGIVWGSWYENDANSDQNVPTPASSTRIDRFVLRKSWASQTVRITRIAGVEGGGAPALTQSAGTTWDTPLCQVSITTGAVITITDQREFIGFTKIGAHCALVNSSFTIGAAAAVAFAAADVSDTDNFHDPASNNTRIIIPTGFDGVYEISSQVRSGVGDGYLIHAQLRKNGVAITGGQGSGYSPAGSGFNPTGYAEIRLPLVAGDYIEVYASIAPGSQAGATATLEAELVRIN